MGRSSAAIRVWQMTCLIVLCSLLPTTGIAVERDVQAPNSGLPYLDPRCQSVEYGAGADVVEVGMYIRSIPEIDVKANSFMADFFLWFRWMPKDDFDPSKSFELVNARELWDVSLTPIYVGDAGESQPEILPNGQLYQIVRVHARFQSAFDLRKYPLDSHVIGISVEEAERVAERVRYVWDEGKRLDPSISVPGWFASESKSTIQNVGYETNFGYKQSTNGEECYSRATANVQLTRPLVGSLVKTVLPISLVMLITFVTFFIRMQFFEGRIGLAITSLISAVALQLTAADSLPDVAYLVLLDKVYNLSYAVIFIALAETVVAERFAVNGRESWVKWLDRSAFYGCVALFFGGVFWLMLG